MPDESNHLERLCAQFEVITVPDSDHVLNQGAGTDRLDIGLAADQSGSGGSSDRAQRLPVITVPMCGRDGVQRRVGDDLQKSIIVVGCVDEQAAPAPGCSR